MKRLSDSPILVFFAALLITCKSESQAIEKSSAAADVLSVTASGEENNYQFSVTLSSPDTGCEQYADWWEVVSESGDLIYRRILAHSHVNEQPFTRNGGVVKISMNQPVWVRAHMNNSGYGGKTMFGTVSDGFSEEVMSKDFANDLETEAPFPSDCSF